MWLLRLSFIPLSAGFINVGVLCDINLGTQALKIASFLDHFPLFIAMPFYESLLQNLALWTVVRFNLLHFWTLSIKPTSIVGCNMFRTRKKVSFQNVGSLDVWDCQCSAEHANDPKSDHDTGIWSTHAHLRLKWVLYVTTEFVSYNRGVDHGELHGGP